MIPVALDKGLPDYLIKTEMYAKNMRISWATGDRFRIFFGGKISSKTHKMVRTGGTWHRGVIVDVLVPQPGAGATLREKESYDPWESLVVYYDGKRECMGVGGMRTCSASVSVWGLGECARARQA